MPVSAFFEIALIAMCSPRHPQPSGSGIFRMKKEANYLTLLWFSDAILATVACADAANYAERRCEDEFPCRNAPVSLVATFYCWKSSCAQQDCEWLLQF